MTDKFLLACIQMNSGSDMQANIATASRLVKEAKEKGAALAILPENVALMKETGTSYDNIAFTEANHPFLAAATDWAKDLQLFIQIGSLAIRDPGLPKLSNRSLLLSPSGKVVARYDKIHLFDVSLPDGKTYNESANFLHGSEAVAVRLPFGTLGMTVCYDVRFPQLYRALAKAGAEVITVPAAFTKLTGEAHWHTLLCARAIETGCYIAASTQYGTHPGKRETFGHALIVDPWGTIIAEATTPEEQVILAEVDRAKVTKARSHIPALQHDREFSVVVL